MLEILDQEMEKDRNLIAAARDEASTIDRCSPPPETGACNHDIPGYELVRRIGGGGQGTVYEAVQSSTGRRVALKVIRSDRASSSRWRRFEREVRLLARLQHAHIVTVYDSGHTDDCLYFAMELVDGQRFNEYVHHAGLDRRRSLTVFAEVCDAVHAAHQRGVMHRDLKPANILVDDAGVPHVLDFGLAKLILESDDETRSDAALTQDGQFLGTIGWASPEQVQGDPEDVDIRTDVYSLGVILFELLTGIPPYDTNRPLREAIDNIIHVQPERPSTLDRAIDDDLETIALRCLAKEPDRRYGSVGELASDLRRYLTGEPIEAKRDSRLYVLRKTLFRHRVIVAIATTALLFGLGFGVVMTGLYQDARQAREDAEVEITILREEIQELKAELVDPANWTSAFHTARALGKLSPTEGWTLLKSAWDEMTEDDPKQQLLKAANVAQPPYLPRVLHLGMTDPSPAVQSWAINCLRSVAFVDFADDFTAYQRWHATYGEQPLDAVLAANLRAFVQRLRESDAAARGALLQRINPERTLARHAELGQLAYDAGVAKLLMELVTSGRDPRRAAAGMLASMPLDEQFLCKMVLPHIHGPEAVRGGALHILERHKSTCAIEPILAAMQSEFRKPEGKRDFVEFARTLAAIGNARVIPALIAMIGADDTYDTVYGIGYFGLGKLTGVQYDESHDGAWWRRWWEANRTRYPEAVRSLEIPELKFPDEQAESTRGRQNEREVDSRVSAEPDLPVQSLVAGGDQHKRYFLFGPKHSELVPPEGGGLLLVLPGGDGGEGFQPFVGRVANEGVPGTYLVAQLVAPRWSDDQFKQIVWPSADNPWKGMKFSTEEFVRAVVQDIRERYAIDPRFVFALGWSSGGPPVYASTLAPESPVRGALVAMSVFKPDTLPDLAAAKGKAYYILHSPEDFIPMKFPQAARDQLRLAGGTTMLVSYEDGHGWHGDVYSNIRRGLFWLEHQTD